MENRKGISRIQQHFKKAILFFSIFFLSTLHAQTVEVSVPFTNGFIGVAGNGQSATSIKTFTTLGIAKAFFVQQSSSASFQLQGNDIPGVVRIQLNSGQVIDIQGAIVWRQTNGNTVKSFGFIPAPTITSIGFSYGGGTYTINTLSSLVLNKINEPIVYTDNTSENGNAATGQNLLDDLNAYLTVTQGLRPAGPVTVTAQTTSNTTPTVTGTATIQAGETLSVTVNGVVYTTANGLVITGNTWSLPISSALTTGSTYPVTATITNTGGYTLSDSTTNELVITQAGVPAVITSVSQLVPFSTCLGSASAVQSFSVSGTSLTANVVVTAPTGFEVSLTNGSGYGSSVTISPTAGTLSSTPVYVRMIVSATGSLSGNISVVSGSVSQNVAVSGTVNSNPVTPTASVTSQPTCSVGTGTITVSSSTTGLSFSIDGTNYTNTTGIFSGVLPGTYTVTAKNASSCISSASTSVTVNAQPATPSTPTASVTSQPTCSVGTGTITVSSSTTGLSFSIDGTNYTNTTGIFSGVLPGTYTVTAKNASSCVSPASTSVTVNAQPATPSTPTASVTSQPTCSVGTGTITVSSST
ncbi:hypothetical protein, partial [Flavobacterium sp.]|uniref:hypothetical protein n=1 Tax=Flavobacterium sp. TaxID=239 RepID=UPI0025E6727B